MRHLLTLAASAALFSGLACAETWTGRLVDANCTNQDKTAKDCDAGSTATAFLLVVDGKMFQLDDAGNRKAAAGIKNRADRAADPTNPKASAVIAKVTGDNNAGVLKVDTIEVQ